MPSLRAIPLAACALLGAAAAEAQTTATDSAAVLEALKELQADFEEFRPQEQRKPLDPRRDIRVSPPSAGEVFADGKKLYLRILRPTERSARVTVRFPNEEEATLLIDLARAGAGPVIVVDPEPLLAPPPS